MNEAAYTVPSTVRALLSKLPGFPGSVVFVGGLNLIVKPHLPDDTLAQLEGRSLRIEVRDAGVAFDFVYRSNAFRAARHEGDIALTISASAYDFFLLARRAQDPDTLFFSRRLTMEGDTELGLLVKNSLDAIDLSKLSNLSKWPKFPLARFAPSSGTRGRQAPPQ